MTMLMMPMIMTVEHVAAVDCSDISGDDQEKGEDVNSMKFYKYESARQS